MRPTAAVALVGLASVASAATVYVDNLNPFPMYLNSNANQDPPGPVVTLPARTVNAYHETERGPSSSITINTIRVDTQSDLAHPLIFTYNQNPPDGQTYYALSTVYGDPLAAQGFEILTDGGHPATRCPPRPSGGDCPGTYSPSNTNGNGAVNRVPNGANFTFRLGASDIAA